MSEVERLEKDLLGHAGRAVADFGLIDDGDRIMVAVSGGKDSYTMLHVLRLLQRRAPVRFSLIAVNLDQGHPNFPGHKLQGWLEAEGYEHRMLKEDTYSIVLEKLKPGVTQCSLCSRLRRGVLYNAAVQLECNKIALGHHRDDLIHTLLLNQFFAGTTSTMPPKLRSNDGRNTVIRPLVYAPETLIAKFAEQMQFPIIPCNLCGSQENLQRKKVKKLVDELEREHPFVRSSLMKAMGNLHTSHLLDPKLWQEAKESNMPRDAAIAARKNRNSALVEAMVMAAIADGSIEQNEMEMLIRRVIERPEFEGTKPEELNALIEGSAKKLSQSKRLEDVLTSLRDRLPDHKNRLLAFGLAAAVALADRRATREELGLLKTFQMGLGISEAEVQEVFTAIEAGQPLNEVLGEPKERLYAEVMVLVSVIDGKVSAKEASAIVEALAGDPVFREISMDRAQLFVRDAMQALSDDGMAKRLVVMAHSLTTHAQRLKAYGLAARVAKAGGNKPAELHVLELLQATFGLADDEVARIKREF